MNFVSKAPPPEGGAELVCAVDPLESGSPPRSTSSGGPPECSQGETTSIGCPRLGQCKPPARRFERGSDGWPPRVSSPLYPPAPGEIAPYAHRPRPPHRLLARRARVAAPCRGGDDWVDAFRVGQEGGAVTVTKVAAKHLYCTYPSPRFGGDKNYCNLDASGGVFVAGGGAAGGELIVYGTPHDNDGPAVDGRASIDLIEFRSTFPNPGRNTSIGRAFVELYDDSDFSDRGLMIDYPDEGRRNYADFKRVEGFTDKASALRYCLPPGWAFRLYKDDTFRGGTLELRGTGALDLNSQSFGDAASSGRFLFVGP